MKRLIAAVLLILLVSFCSAVTAEEMRPFSRTLQTLYAENGCEILSSTECGHSGAAVIRRENELILSVLSEHAGEWSIDFENPHAVCEKSSVFLDTDALLILSDPFGWQSEAHDQYYFTLKDRWVLTSVIRYENRPDEWNLLTEHHASLSDGWLRRETVLNDENDNMILTTGGMPLPDVLTESERSLEGFDCLHPVIVGEGYLTDSSMLLSDSILRRLFAASVPADYEYADGMLNEDGLQFIADRADGSRVLLCCECDPDGCRITVSTPLPEGTLIGIENFTETLNLGLKNYGVNIGKDRSGRWGVQGVLGEEYFTAGPCWVSSGLTGSVPAIGTLNWNDITAISWEGIPQSTEQAKAMIDPSGWATPANPDPEDRLHLREKPRRDSLSRGKYYNGTPIRVLEKSTEWTKVRIGSTEGYMMTKYLCFGTEINARPTALKSKVCTHPFTEILWDDSAVPERITADQAAQLLIVGVDGDEWYLVWDPRTDAFGRIRQTELWDGNG